MWNINKWAFRLGLWSEWFELFVLWLVYNNIWLFPMNYVKWYISSFLSPSRWTYLGFIKQDWYFVLIYILQGTQFMLKNEWMVKKKIIRAIIQINGALIAPIPSQIENKYYWNEHWRHTTDHHPSIINPFAHWLKLV